MSTVRSRASAEPLRKANVFSFLLFGAFISVLFGATLTASAQTAPQRAPQTIAQGIPQSTPKQHTIAVQFFYDFKWQNGCPAKSPCVKQFNVYNVTEHGQRTLLFTINAPAGANGKRVPVSGQSKPRAFAAGQHMIAVTAQWDTGPESALLACTTMVDIKD